MSLSGVYFCLGENSQGSNALLTTECGDAENWRGPKKYHLLKPIAQNWKPKLGVIERIIRKRDRDQCKAANEKRSRRHSVLTLIITEAGCDYLQVVRNINKLNSTNCFGEGHNESEDHREGDPYLLQARAPGFLHRALVWQKNEPEQERTLE